MSGDWPVDLEGVTETIVTTRGPNGRWNAAALGVHAGEGTADPTARTWGPTRTRRNFAERGGGYVQFTRDPVDFAEAALSIHELDEPRLQSADAWVRVEVVRLEEGTTDGTDWVDWRLASVESAVERRVVPMTNRGYGAIIEATVAASRLDVPGFDRDRLDARIDHLESVVSACGGPAAQAAFDVVRDAADR